MNSSIWRNDPRWNEFQDERFSYARSANNQQITHAAGPEVTSLVFPAIGALLMLVFGGFLLSSSNSCCSSAPEKRNPYRNEEYEQIDFTFISNSDAFPRLAPVLQQENNDVVEAVMATYSDLPQHAPVNDLLVHLIKMESVTKPETRDVCLSPIHDADHIKTPVDIRYQGNNSTIIYESCSASVGNSNNSDVQSVSSGIGSCSKDSRRVVHSSIDYLNFSDTNRPPVPRSKSAPLEPRHTKSILHKAFSLDDQWTLDMSRDSIRSVGQSSCNLHDSCSSFSRDLLDKPCIDDPSAIEGRYSHLTELQTQQWAGQINPGHGRMDDSYHWKHPAQLSKQDKLEILRRLQPRLGDDCGVNQQISKNTGVSKTENTRKESYNNKSCKELNLDSAESVLNDGGRIKGGRQSCLTVVRAPSTLCIHSNKCQVHDRTDHVTDTPIEEGHFCLNDSGRGASCFAESTSTLRGASAFGDQTRGASVFGEPVDESRDFAKSRDTKSSENVLPGCDHLKGLRGASSFGGTEFYAVNKGIPLKEGVRTYGEVTSCLVTGGSEQSTNDIHGASGFGQSRDCVSTASVTLSMAVQSEKEDFIDNDSVVDNQQEEDVAKQLKRRDLEEKTEREFEKQNRNKNDIKTIGNHEKQVEYSEQCRVGVRPKSANQAAKVEYSLKDTFMNKKVIETFKARDRTGLEEDQPNRSSTPKDAQSIAKTLDLRMGLGRDSSVLSGLLKALQREKLKKTNKTIDGKVEKVPSSETKHCPLLENPKVDEIRKDEGHRKLVGKIKVCLFYTRSDTTKPVLYATVLKAYSLRYEYVRPAEEFLVEMQMNTRDNSTQKTKSVKEYKKSIVFNHLFHIPSIKTRELEISVLKLMLVNGLSDECVGVATMPLADLVSRDKIKKTCLLRRTSSSPRDVVSSQLSFPVPVGTAYLGLKYNAVEEKLLVHVIKVRGLPVMAETGETDPYVLVTVKDDGKTVEEKMTETKWKQRNPVFDAKYVFDLNNRRVQTCSILLRIMNNAANHCLIGIVKIGLDSEEESGRWHWNDLVIKPGVLQERWHKLVNENRTN